MKPLSLVLWLMVFPIGANSQEIRIGHLETADDIGINWLFFHCNQAGNTLKCSIFQTLIFKPGPSDMVHEPATCSVGNDYSESVFKWNQATQNWISQEGPTGPCGRINIGILERDPQSSQYWKYTEKKITTKPDGVNPDGPSCMQVAKLDSTFHYTWRAAKNASGCQYIKNLMN